MYCPSMPCRGRTVSLSQQFDRTTTHHQDEQQILHYQRLLNFGTESAEGLPVHSLPHPTLFLNLDRFLLLLRRRILFVRFFRNDVLLCKRSSDPGVRYRFRVGLLLVR